MWQSRILFEQGYVGKFGFPGMGGQRPIFSNISVYCLKWLFEFSGVVGMGVWSATRDISLDPLIKGMFKTSNFICTCNCAGHHLNLGRLRKNYFTKSKPSMTGVSGKKYTASFILRINIFYYKAMVRVMNNLANSFSCRLMFTLIIKRVKFISSIASPCYPTHLKYFFFLNEELHPLSLFFLKNLLSLFHEERTFITDLCMVCGYLDIVKRDLALIGGKTMKKDEYLISSIRLLAVQTEKILQNSFPN